MNSIIVLAFPCCGKTDVVKSSEALFRSHVKTIVEVDCRDYAKEPGWADKYVDDLLKHVGKAEVIFGTLHIDVLTAIHKRGVPYTVIIPSQAQFDDGRTRKLTKQQWVGRAYLSGSNVEDILRVWDTLTNENLLKACKPTMILYLSYNNYISDVMDKIYAMLTREPKVFAIEG